jgi:hypothetical protein
MDERDIENRANELREWLIDIDKNVEQIAHKAIEASKQRDDLIRAHRDGWRQVANAIQQGFELVALAIRDRR